MKYSLHKNSEFQQVYKNGKSLANKYLIMYVLPSEAGESRLGCSVSKKVGNSVVRHRIARLLRESFRLNCEKFHSSWNIVCVARSSARGKSFGEIESAFLDLSEKHGLI